MFIGAPLDSTSDYVKSGRVLIYTRSSSSSPWTFWDALPSIYQGDNYLFGWYVAVSTSTDLLMIGAPGCCTGDAAPAGEGGKVFVYEMPSYNRTMLNSRDILQSPDPMEMGFGSAIALGTDAAFIGTQGSSVVYLFKLSNYGLWSCDSTLYNQVPFGSSLFWFGTKLYIGSPQSNSNKGAVLQFSLIEATDVLTEAPVASPIAESPIADSISNDLTEPPSDAVPTEPPTPYIIADTEAPSKLNVNTLGHATIQYVLYNDLLSYNQSDVGFGTALAASATELFIGTNREVVYRCILTMSGSWQIVEAFHRKACPEGSSTGNYITLNEAGTELVINSRCSCLIYHYTKQEESGWNLIQTFSGVCCKSGVALADDVMFIGAPLDDSLDYNNSGRVLIYSRSSSSSSWAFRDAFSSTYSGNGQLFGWSVAVSTFIDVLMVGAPGCCETPSIIGPAVEGEGQVFVYAMAVGNRSRLTPQGAIVLPSFMSDRGFGASIAIGSDAVFIGTQNSGKVYVFSKRPSSTSMYDSWDLGFILENEAKTFGSSLYWFGENIFIASPGNVTTKGRVAFYVLIPPTPAPTIEPYVPTVNIPIPFPTGTYNTEGPTIATTPLDSPVVPMQMPYTSPTIATDAPTMKPTHCLTASPSRNMTAIPSIAPTDVYTSPPTEHPTIAPTEPPIDNPTILVPSTTAGPTAIPPESAAPTEPPTRHPSCHPSFVPSEYTTPAPTTEPTTTEPTFAPVEPPTIPPVDVPYRNPTVEPSVVPTSVPTCRPTYNPSRLASASPTVILSPTPSCAPSRVPSSRPTTRPTSVPTKRPSHAPISMPTNTPSCVPTFAPSSAPTVPILLTFNIQETGSNSVLMNVETNGAQGSVYCLAIPSASTRLFFQYDIDYWMAQGRGGEVISFPFEVAINGLTPLTRYVAYCIIIDESRRVILGNITQFYAQGVAFSTSCCHVAEVSIVAPIIALGVNGVPVVEVKLSSKPSKYVTIQVATRETASRESASVMVLGPAAVNITKYDSTATTTFKLMSSVSEGEYDVSVVLSGPSSEDYIVKYSTFRAFTITSKEIPPPQLTSSMFSSDGSQLIIKFDILTDRALFESPFPCDALFSFPGVTNTLCDWIDDATVIASLGSTAILNVGDVLLLNPQRIKAKCPALGKCTEWLFAESGSIKVALPQDPIIPIVAISAPAIITTCSSIQLDLSGSTGSVGRPWSSVAFKVTSSDPNVNHIETFLNNKSYVVMPPSKVPETLFTSLFQYSIRAELCNPFGTCGSAVHNLQVTDSDVPTLRIQGSKARVMKASQELTLYAIGYIERCNNTALYSDLRYNWTVYKVSGLQRHALLALTGPTLKLRSNTLAAGFGYEIFCLLYRDGASHISTTASVMVDVVFGSLQARIAGALSRSASLSETIIIDASDSFDEDSTSSDFLFEWDCAVVYPVENSNTCGVTLPLTMSPILSITGGIVNSTSKITVTARHVATDRAAQAFVYVTVVSGASSDIAVDNSYINVDSKVLLTGQIRTTQGGLITWVINDESVSLTDRALTPINVSITNAEVALRSNMIYSGFALSSYSLSAGRQYTFTMMFVPYTGKPINASVQIATNAAPAFGNFQVIPGTGFLLDTLYTFFASQWTDVDLPLTYTFAYSSDAVSFYAIQSKTEMAYGSTILPGGLLSRNYSTVIRLQVSDSLMASSIAVNTVQVKPAVAVIETKETLLSKIQEAMGDRKDKDALKWTVGMSLSILNTVNCSNAPNCTALNRKSCSAVPQTCGPCASNLFLGDSGYANTLCISPNHNGTISNTTLKRCPNDCSGHGKCAFATTVNGFSDLVSDCLLTDAMCTAECICHEGYSGSSCSYDQLMLTKQQEIRTELIGKTSQLLELEDVDDGDVLQSIATVLSNIVSVPDELSPKGIEVLIQVTSSLLNAAANVKVSSETLNDVLEVVAAIETKNNTGTLAVEISSQLGLYNEALSGNMAIGESKSHVTSSFRASTLKVDTSTPNTIRTPALSTAGSIRRGVMTARLGKLSSTNQNATASTEIAPLGVSVVEYTQRKYDSKLNAVGTSYQMFYSRNPCQNAETKLNCYINVTVPYYITDSIRLTTDEESLPRNDGLLLNCSYGETKTITYNCSSSSSILVANCNGSWAGSFSRMCPIVTYAPTCALVLRNQGLNVSEERGRECTVLSYTRDSVTCRCPMTALINAWGQQQNRPQTSSPEFLPLLKHSVANFKGTWVSAASLDVSTIERGYVVIACIGTLTVLGAILLVASSKLDARDRNLAHNENKNKAVDPSSTNAMRLTRREFFDLDNMILLPSKGASNSYAWFKNTIYQMKRHHRWLNVIFTYSSTSSRTSRCLLIIGYVLFNMFGNTLLFSLTQPSDGSCSIYVTEIDCTNDNANMDNGSGCYWSNDSNTCEARAVNIDMVGMVYMSLISALFSVPFVMVQEYLITKYICADDLNTNSEENDPSDAIVNTSKNKSIEGYRLLSELESFRMSLPDESKVQLDEMWANASPTYPISAVFKDITQVNESVRINRSAILKTVALDSAANTRLMHLFLFDLMPYAASLAVNATQRREIDERPQPAPRWKKNLSWCYVFISNIGVFAYILLFSLQQEKTVQANWLRSLALWLFFDIIIFSTMSTYIVDMYIPSLFASDIKAANTALQTVLGSQVFSANVHEEFNACKYLFVSYKVAALFPYLPASKVILHYSSPWPRRSYRFSLSLRGAVATLIVILFKAIVELPPSLQDEVYKGIIKVTSINALIVVNIFGLAEAFSLILTALAVIAVVYVAHMILTYISNLKDAKKTRHALVSSNNNSSYLEKRDVSSLTDRRASLQLGLNAIYTMQANMISNQNYFDSVSSDDSVGYSLDDSSDSSESLDNVLEVLGAAQVSSDSTISSSESSDS